MLKKLFLFICVGMFSFINLSAEEFEWSSVHLFTDTVVGVDDISIVQDGDYVFALWGDGVQSSFTLYYAYSSDKGFSWSTPVSSGITSTYVLNAKAVMTGSLVVLSYYDGSNAYVNYFDVDAVELGNSPLSLGSSAEFYLVSKGTKACWGSEKALFCNSNMLDKDNFASNWEEVDMSSFKLFSISDLVMQTEDYAFFVTNKNDTTSYLYLYKVDLSDLIVSYVFMYSQSDFFEDIFIAANEDNEVFVMFDIPGDTNLYYLKSDGTLCFYDVGLDYISLRSVDFKGENILCSFYDALNNTFTSYVLTGKYADGDIIFDLPENLTNDGKMSTESSVELVENYACYSWVEYDLSGNYTVNAAIKNLEEGGDWQIKENLSTASGIGSSFVLFANYTGTSDGTLQLIWPFVVTNATKIETAYVSIPLSSELVLSYDKNEYSFLLQNVFGNKIKWDLLEDAEYYNVYRDANLSDIIYRGKNSYFVDYSSGNTEQTYYVSWVNFEGVEQKATSIVVPKKQ